MAGMMDDKLPVEKAYRLEKQQTEHAWLIESVWARSAVGIIGGAPKCCKSWLGLDMAVSVASGSACLDRFEVQDKGPALVFLAEDALCTVRSRIDALCGHRKIDIEDLDLSVITAPALRLDLSADQNRLQRTLADLHPRLLVLDPLVRLHRLDENSASDISKLLGFVRELQRTHDCAIVLVHHASKKHRAQPGQSLRGSSDLHAFGDSNAYLTRRKKRLALTLEHRSAKPPDPIEVELVSHADGSQTHLKIVCTETINANQALPLRVLAVLNRTRRPMTRTSIRERLKVNNQRLGHAINQLQQQGKIMHVKSGWVSISGQGEINDDPSSS
jgi:hypothetical protein